MKEDKKTSYTGVSKPSPEQIQHRNILYKLSYNRPMSDEELLICPGLYMRNSSLANV